MFREAVHTRCGHGIDIVTGRRFDIDGYKVHDIDGTLLTDDKIDKRLLSDQLLTRIPGKSDGYSYFVPDLGESSLVGYHSVDSGADRHGNFVSQAYVGDFTDVYPFTTFGDDATWDAKQTSESDYYKRIPTFGTYTKSAIGSRRFEMSDVAEFISHGNRNLLLRRLLSFIIDEFKKPIGKRRSVIIRDVSEHDIEMWVKAAELAFSPRIAASISFTTRIESLRSNFYTVDDRMRYDGIDLTRGDEFQRSMYMLVGIIDDEDGAPIIEIGHNQRYVMLDGKTMTFDGCEHETPSLLRYLDIVTSYTLAHRTFVTEFLQMLDITQPDMRLGALAEAFTALTDTSSTISAYAEAAKFVTREKKLTMTQMVTRLYASSYSMLVRCMRGSVDKASIDEIASLLEKTSDMLDADLILDERFDAMQRALAEHLVSSDGDVSIAWYVIKKVSASDVDAAGDAMASMDYGKLLSDNIDTVLDMDEQSMARRIAVYANIIRLTRRGRTDVMYEMIRTCAMKCMDSGNSAVAEYACRAIRTGGGGKGSIANLWLDAARAVDDDLSAYMIGIWLTAGGYDGVDGLMRCCGTMRDAGYADLIPDAVNRFTDGASWSDVSDTIKKIGEGGLVTPDGMRSVLEHVDSMIGMCVVSDKRYARIGGDVDGVVKVSKVIASVASNDAVGFASKYAPCAMLLGMLRGERGNVGYVADRVLEIAAVCDAYVHDVARYLSMCDCYDDNAQTALRILCESDMYADEIIDTIVSGMTSSQYSLLTMLMDVMSRDGNLYGMMSWKLATAMARAGIDKKNIKRTTKQLPKQLRPTFEAIAGSVVGKPKMGKKQNSDVSLDDGVADNVGYQATPQQWQQTPQTYQGEQNARNGRQANQPQINGKRKKPKKSPFGGFFKR